MKLFARVCCTLALLGALPAGYAVEIADVAPVKAEKAVRTMPSGTWEGTYRYNDASRPAVQFILIATVQGNRFSGKISEPNTFGEAGTSFLKAEVSGTLEGNFVRFTKTYNGAGGQIHAVEYEGVYERKTATVRGQWAIGLYNGTFEMTLKP